MEHATVQVPVTRARHRFALGGVALALAAGLGAPVLAGAAARAWDLPIEAALIAAFVFVGLTLLGVGWSLGRRVGALADGALPDPVTPVTKIGDRRHVEERLAREADRALDAEKPSGRDRVEVYDKLGPSSSSVIYLDERRRARKRHTRGSR